MFAVAPGRGDLHVAMYNGAMRWLFVLSLLTLAPSARADDASFWLDLDVGWRLGLGGPAGRVPEFVPMSLDEEGPGVWGRAGRVWQLETRVVLPRPILKSAILPMMMVTGRFESHHTSRRGASTRAYTVGTGPALVSSSRYAGGTTNAQFWDRSARYDSKGRPCSQTYGNECTHRREGGEWGTISFDYSPGELIGWGAPWIGWRQVSDVLLGDGEEDDEIGSGGGPVLGAQFVADWGDIFTFSMRHEFVYYVTGWDDHGHLGYGGRIAGGLRWAEVELQWRADPGTGGEFTFGVIGRLPLIL